MTKIEYWRMKRGLTQLALSARSGVSVGSINRIERHGRVPYGSSIGRTARALDIDPMELIEPPQVPIIPAAPTKEAIPMSSYVPKEKIPCTQCGKEFYPKPHHLRLYRANKPVFHSVECMNVIPAAIPCVRCRLAVTLTPEQQEAWRHGRRDFYDNYHCAPADFNPMATALGSAVIHEACYARDCHTRVAYRCMYYGKITMYSCRAHAADWAKQPGKKTVPL